MSSGSQLMKLTVSIIVQWSLNALKALGFSKYFEQFL